MRFIHPHFGNDQEWFGCTTESLRWNDPDYDEHAGTVGVKASSQADSSPHLFFVDLAVRTNDGREIVLERIEGGKLLSLLMWAQDAAQRDKTNPVIYDLKARA